MNTPRRIAIVGSSLAGVRTIKALRRKGYAGTVVLIGEEDELPYDRPPLSKQFLTSPESPHPKLLEPASFYDDIELRLGARAVDLRLGERAVVLEDGGVVQADDVIITTGGLARTLPTLEGIDGVTTLRTANDARRIREMLDTDPRVVVIGGGFIGCEIAVSARQRGLDVTMVERLPAPVMREVGALVGGTIAALHRQNGVDVRLGVTISSFTTKRGRIRSITLTDGTTVSADLVVLGIGANPRTDWLDGSGLVLRNGLACDQRCHALGGGGHVWAAGDVSSWPSDRFGDVLRIGHWTNAAEQANALAANLLHPETAPIYDPIPYFWSDQYEHRYQVLGTISPQDDVMLISGSLRESHFAIAYSRAGRLRGLVACDIPEAIAEARPKLGADPARLVELQPI